MVNFGSLPIQLLAAASVVLSSPVSLSSRAVINHDAVQSFPEAVPNTVIGQLMTKHKPFLRVFNGCVPFPAVDKDGNTSGGLKPSGSDTGGCRSSTGQVYTRAGTLNGGLGIMYAWYMPKDSPSTGLGHRHDWEHIVVWLDSASLNARIRGVAYSAHGGYDKSTSPPLEGSRPKVGYQSIWPVNHQLLPTSSLGGQQPMIAWENMTPAARDAIERTDFEAATPTFRDSNFMDTLGKSYV